MTLASNLRPAVHNPIWRGAGWPAVASRLTPPRCSPRVSSLAVEKRCDMLDRNSDAVRSSVAYRAAFERAQQKLVAQLNAVSASAPNCGRKKAAAAKRQDEMHRWAIDAHRHWRIDRDRGSPPRFEPESYEGPDPELLKERKPPHAQLFSELASLALVPVAGGEKLRQDVSSELDALWATHWYFRFSSKDRDGRRRRSLAQLKRLKRLASDLDAALENLDRVALDYLKRESAAIPSCQREVAALAKASSAAHRRVLALHHVSFGRRGRLAWYNWNEDAGGGV